MYWYQRTLTVTTVAALAVATGPAAAQPVRPTAADQRSATISMRQAGSADILRRALAANPITAPYPIAVEPRDERVALTGVVGTKMIHDAAVRVAIATGIPFIDDLVIDTAASASLALQSGAMGGAGRLAPFPTAPTYGGPMPYYGPNAYPPPTYMQFGGVPGGPPGLVYPPPLFGVIDEPFFGFEPPVISYPPYWGALSARRLGGTAAFNAGAGQGAMAAGPGAMAGGPGAMAGGPGAMPAPPPGVVDMEIDPYGVATLRGTVPSLADRVAIGQKVARTPGVTEVINLLNVGPVADASEGAGAAPAPAEERALDPEAPAALGDPAPPVEPPAGVRLDPQVGRADFGADDPGPLGAMPALDGLPIRVSLRDGIATLEGEVDSAVDAMVAYLAVKRHPAVDLVVDQLRFAVPIEPRENPLLRQGDRRDVEEYLGEQVRRQIGDQARVDRITLLGDRLEVEARIDREADRRRVEAILRSTPILRGFRLAPDLSVSPD